MKEDTPNYEYLIDLLEKSGLDRDECEFIIREGLKNGR